MSPFVLSCRFTSLTVCELAGTALDQSLILFLQPCNTGNYRWRFQSIRRPSCAGEKGPLDKWRQVLLLASHSRALVGFSRT